MAARKRKQESFVHDHSILEPPYVYDSGDDDFSLSEDEEGPGGLFTKILRIILNWILSQILRIWLSIQLKFLESVKNSKFWILIKF